VDPTPRRLDAVSPTLDLAVVGHLRSTWLPGNADGVRRDLGIGLVVTT
jgi:hypothetical protein